MHLVEASHVCSKTGSWKTVTAKWALVYFAFCRAAPWASPMLREHDFLRRLFDKELDGILVCEKICAFNCVIGMKVKRIFFLHGSAGSALSTDRVCSEWMVFGDNGNVEFVVGFSSGNGGSHSRQAGSNDDHVMSVFFHLVHQLI
jgi:hypothetical protein